MEANLFGVVNDTNDKKEGMGAFLEKRAATVSYTHLKETLAANGFTYGASAELTHTDFPEKTYGDYTFPEGNYEALEITRCV